MAIGCDHPRPKLNLPGYTPPRFPWSPPTFLPSASLADLARALTEQFRGVYAVLQQLGQRRTVVPLIEDIDARAGQVIVGVGAGQTIRLPEGIPGELGQVGIVLTDVSTPVTVVNPDGTTQTLGAVGAYDFITGTPEVYQTSPGGTTGSVTTDLIADDAVTDAKLAEMGPNTVKGNPTASTANPTDIAIADLSVLGRMGVAGTGNLEDITVPDTATATGETMFLKGNSARTALRFTNFTLLDLPEILDNRFIGNITGATARPVYTDFGSLNSTTILYTAHSFVREALTGAIEASQNSNATLFSSGASGAGLTGGGTAVLAVGAGTNVTVSADAVSVDDFPLSGLADQAAETFVGNFTAGSAAPTARAGSSVAGDGLTYTAGGTLAVGAGDGIDVAADSVAVDVTDIVDNVTIVEVATNNIQRAALTGFAAASAGSNATTSAEPIVTFSASSNMSNERVLSAGFQTAIDIATPGEIQVDWLGLEVETQNEGVLGDATNLAFINGVNTFAVGVDNGGGQMLVRYDVVDFPLTGLADQADDTFLANISGGAAPPTAVALTTLAGAGLTGGADAILAVGAGTYITVNANDVAVNRTALSADLDSTSVVDSSGTLQRAALTGAITAAQNSNATVFDTNASGAGLTGGGTAVMAVGAGTGITVNANDVAVTIPLTDGDKGDITVASSGTSWTVDTAAITLAKMANLAQSTVIGRAVGAGTGVPTALTTTQLNALVGSDDLTLSNALLLGGQQNETGAMPLAVTLSASTTRLYFLISGDGDINTITTASGLNPSGRVVLCLIVGSGTKTIKHAFSGGGIGRIQCPNNRDHTFGNRQWFGLVSDGANGWLLFLLSPEQLAANSIMANATASADNPVGLAVGTNTVVGRVAGNIVAAQLVTGQIADGNVTDAKLVDMAQSRIKGRAEGAGTGDPTDLTPTQVVAIIDGESPTWTGAHSFTGSAHTVDVSGDLIINGAGGAAIGAGASAPAAPTVGSLNLEADGQVRIFTNGVERLEIEPDGAWQIGGSAGSSGEVLTSAGSAAPPTWSAAPALIAVRSAFAADASISITPPTGATWFEAEIKGGGGGGGGADAETDGEACAGGGGGEAEYCKLILPIISGNITGSIGTGGTAGSNAGGNGGAGGNTVLTYGADGATASGGGGGAGTASGSGEAGTTDMEVTAGGQGGDTGTNTTQKFFQAGQGGDSGIMYSNGTTETNAAAAGGTGGGQGGGRGGAVNNVAATANGENARGNGAGGGGGARIVSATAAATGATGGTGEDGFMIVRFYAGAVPTFAAIT
jgi:hypothetical protein